MARAATCIWPPTTKPSDPFLSKMAKTGRPIDELLGLILGLAVGSTVNFSVAAVQAIDFYLDDERAKEREEIVQLVHRTDDESASLLRGYVREAMREFLFLPSCFPILARLIGFCRLEPPDDWSLAPGSG